MNVLTSYGTSALGIAAIEGFEEPVDILISNGADVNVQAKFSRITPLISAADGRPTSQTEGNRTAYVNIVKTLIKNGADVNHV